MENKESRSLLIGECFWERSKGAVIFVGAWDARSHLGLSSLSGYCVRSEVSAVGVYDARDLDFTTAIGR